MTNPSSQAAHESPVDMIIFGGGGDLAARKLLPALYMAHLHDNLPAETRIIAVGRRDWGIDGYRAFMEEQSRPFIDEKAFDAQAWSRFLDLFQYVLIDVNAADDYQRLVEASRDEAIRVFYLSTSPELFTTICDNLAAAKLLNPASRVVLEKPLGHDLASAQAINNDVGRHFAESQIYRIDHYLGKETVQN
ncbi:MAG: glucose-6-phosphate dehydrogenase, partial [Burkholderia gladioli]